MLADVIAIIGPLVDECVEPKFTERQIARAGGPQSSLTFHFLDNTACRRAGLVFVLASKKTRPLFVWKPSMKRASNPCPKNEEVARVDPADRAPIILSRVPEPFHREV
jgi:hypothetical protein